uniref:Polycomb complex protein BMI-1 n=1 Tax=Schistocephalus solidus TaxID=70667 RepID=A0A0X3P4S8_SCHSO
MHKVAHIPLRDLNPLLTCALCQGYLIDATTIEECLHSFCKSCIIKFLERLNTCPVCGTLLHKTRPQYAIRSDHVLQAIVYKLVPNLFENEMSLRRGFYSKLPFSERRSLSPEKRGDLTLNIYKPNEEERLSVELEYWRTGDPATDCLSPDLPAGHTTYLLCPAGLTIGHLEKLIRLKFELKPGFHEVAVFFSSDDYFSPDYTLSDLACLYSWRRQHPMKIYFSVIRTDSDKSPAPSPSSPPCSPALSALNRKLTVSETTAVESEPKKRPSLKFSTPEALSNAPNQALPHSATPTELSTQLSTTGPKLALLANGWG